MKKFTTNNLISLKHSLFLAIEWNESCMDSLTYDSYVGKDKLNPIETKVIPKYNKQYNNLLKENNQFKKLISKIKTEIKIRESLIQGVPNDNL